MAHIHIERSHTLGLEAARHAVEEVAAELRRDYGVRTHWEGNTIKLKGSGVEGALVASASSVQITATLGLLMRPMRGFIESEIERYFRRYVG